MGDWLACNGVCVVLSVSIEMCMCSQFCVPTGVCVTSLCVHPNKAERFLCLFRTLLNFQPVWLVDLCSPRLKTSGHKLEL